MAGRDREYLRSDESRILRYVARAPKISRTHLEDSGDPISIFVEEQGTWRPHTQSGGEDGRGVGGIERLVGTDLLNKLRMGALDV